MSGFNIFFDKGTDPGIKRSTKPNQDYVAYREPENPSDKLRHGVIFIVADGVGGASKGDLASEFATKEVMSGYFRTSGDSVANRLSQIIRHTGNRLYQLGRKQGTRMATTIVSCVVVGKKLYVANVGDSRAYLLRKGKLAQITRDHNIVGEMLRDNRISEEAALRSKSKNKLTRSVGGELDVHVDTFPVDLEVGDRIFLCTDGLTRYTRQEDIRKIVSIEDASQIVDKAISYALNSGGADNVTALVVQIGSAAAIPSVSPLKPLNDPGSMTEIPGVNVGRKRRKQKTNFLLFASLLLIATLAGGYLLKSFDTISLMTDGFRITEAQSLAEGIETAVPTLDTRYSSVSPPSEQVGAGTVLMQETDPKQNETMPEISDCKDLERCICLYEIREIAEPPLIWGAYSQYELNSEEFSAFDLFYKDINDDFRYGGIFLANEIPSRPPGEGSFGWWVVIYGVTDRETCVRPQNPGTWVDDSRP